MKAISIKQPWAWLIASGYMTVENRKWYTAHRGDIMIHASKSKFDLETDINFVQQKFGVLVDRDQLLFGKCLAVAELTGCTKAPQERIDRYCHKEGHFAWILRRIRPIEPFPARGKLNLFDIPFSWDEYPDLITEPIPIGRALLAAGCSDIVKYIEDPASVPAFIRRARK